MSAFKPIFKKELRGYFLSPVAFIFLGVFLLATLFIFFSQAKFFARNLADVRPLFSWLPLLLIFLVAALTQRQWSEEQKMGTLEVLMTLPCKLRDLVLGKFAAGLTLCALALLLTLPLPITAALLGDLDWGPVLGGYIAALLCAATYISIGLCVSSRTDNQIVALMMTALICSLLYLIGSDSVTALVSNQTGEFLRQLGTGSRFWSIERGVLDLRDLVYYASLCLFFLTLNITFLEQKRLQGQKTKGSPHRTTLLLVGLNALALNLWLAPCSVLRLDLTADHEYSVSTVTKQILSDLDEPLTIAAYFSEKTHPLLAPLIPRISDFVREYEIFGQGKVRLVFADPGKDEALETELGERFDVKPVPFRISGRHEEAVVNSYFHIVVTYGDQYAVLGFEDLIELHADQDEVKVRLRNFEYDLTRSIKKVTEGFQSIESVLAQTNTPHRLTAYISPNLPEELAETPAQINKIAEELVQKSGGHFVFETIDPEGNNALKLELAQKFGIRPMSVDLLSGQSFYLHLVYQAGDHVEVIYPQGKLTEAVLRSSIEGAIRRGTPGFLKTIGLVTETPEVDPRLAMYGERPGKPDFQLLEQQLTEDFTFKRLDLKEGTVPGDIDVLMIAKPGSLSDLQRYAIDQYLMRGGSVLVMSGAFDMKPGYDSIDAHKVDDAFLKQLESYGVKVERGFAMDPQNTKFPVPVAERRGGFTLERIVMIPYPFFPDIRAQGFARGHAALRGISSLAFTWGSPLQLQTLKDGVTGEVLLRTSDQSWLRKSLSTEPDTDNLDDPFPKGDAPTDSFALAVSLAGSFDSAFKEVDAPTAGDEDKAQGQKLDSATADARLIVIGSSSIASDLVTQIGLQMGSGSFKGNNVFIRNMIDFALSDLDLLQIRSGGAFARTLRPMTADERLLYECVDYAVVLAALIGVLMLALTRRRMTRPMTLTDEEEQK